MAWQRVALAFVLVWTGWMGGYWYAAWVMQDLIEAASDLNTRTEAMLEETCLKEYAVWQTGIG